MPLLRVLELARQVSRRRTAAADESPIPPQADPSLEEVRRHLEVELCPLCRTWFDNAVALYRARRRRSPLRRIPQQRPAALAFKTGPGPIELRLPASPRGKGLDTLPAVLVLQPFPGNRGTWMWKLEWRSRQADPRDGAPAERLAAFARKWVRVTFHLRGAEHPVAFCTVLGLGAEGSLVTPPERLALADPDQVDRVSIRRCRPPRNQESGDRNQESAKTRDS
jgi:hypothetical protein